MPKATPNSLPKVPVSLKNHSWKELLEHGDTRPALSAAGRRSWRELFAHAANDND